MQIWAFWHYSICHGDSVFFFFFMTVLFLSRPHRAFIHTLTLCYFCKGFREHRRHCRKRKNWKERANFSSCRWEAWYFNVKAFAMIWWCFILHSLQSRRKKTWHCHLDIFLFTNFSALQNRFLHSNHGLSLSQWCNSRIYLIRKLGSSSNAYNYEIIQIAYLSNYHNELESCVRVEHGWKCC